MPMEIKKFEEAGKLPERKNMCLCFMEQVCAPWPGLMYTSVDIDIDIYVAQTLPSKLFVVICVFWFVFK